MLPRMGFLDSLRKAISGPARVGGDDPGEVSAAMHEEYAAPAPGEEESKQIEQLSEEPRAPIAAAPFAGSGESRAAEIEDPLLSEEADNESQEDSVNPDT